MDDPAEAPTQAAEQTALRLIGEAALGARSALSLAGLGLTTLPEALGTLSALTRLDLSGNRLAELPEWIGELSELEELVLRGNELVRLPAALGRLERLARLDAADNRLVEIPAGIARLPRLAMLDLSGNRHLILPPPQIVELGSHEVLEYLRGFRNTPPDARTPDARALDARAIDARTPNARTATETAPLFPPGTGQPTGLPEAGEHSVKGGAKPRADSGARPRADSGAKSGAEGGTALLPFDASLATQTQPLPRPVPRTGAALAARTPAHADRSDRANHANPAEPPRSRRAAAIGGAAFVLVVAGVLAASLSGGSSSGSTVDPQAGGSVGAAQGQPDAFGASSDAASGFGATQSPAGTTGSRSGSGAASGSASARSSHRVASKTGSTTSAPTHAVAPVYPTAAPNLDLALGRPVSASSIIQNYVASNAVDGNADTYWESQDNAGFPQTLTVDLGEVTTVARFVFSLPQESDWNSRTETFTILGSTNGSSFFTVRGSATYSFNANSSSDDSASVTVSATHVRYIELYFTATDGWPAAQIGELGIYS